MPDRATLKMLGWSDELIDAIEARAHDLPRGVLTRVVDPAVSTRSASMVSDRIETGGEPPVGLAQLVAR